MDKRLPPHDPDAEKALLGGILVDSDAIFDVDFLEPSHFYAAKHRQIFTAMRKQVAAQEPVDIISIAGMLPGEDPLVYLMGLTSATPTAIYVQQYGRRVWETSKRRELLRTAGEMADMAFDEESEIASLLDGAQTSVIDVAADTLSSGLRSVSEGLDEFLDTVLSRRHRREQGEEIFMRTGLADVDSLIGGFESGDLIIIAGRPGMGKSMLENTIRINMARDARRIAIFNLEMSEEKILLRMSATQSGIDSRKIWRGEMSVEELGQLGSGVEALKRLPIWIDDTPAATVTQMHGAARRLKAQHGLDLITVDYLGLMTTHERYQSRYSEVGAISRGLKAMAKDLAVPVLALAQLNRTCETRADKRPMLSDLRDSGDIEQDASVVMFLYRDAYYNEFSDFENKAELNIAKNREGEAGRVDLFYDPAHSRFANYRAKVTQL